MEKNKKVNFSVIYDKYIARLLPVISLLLMVVIFGVLTEGKSLALRNLNNLLNQGVITAVVATGATFIYASGSFDISLGAATAVSAIIGAMAYNQTGSIPVMFLVCILTAMLILGFSSVASTLLRLPVFIVTIVMMSVLSALQELLLKGQNYSVDRTFLKPLETNGLKYLVFLVFFLFCVVLFHFTRFGRGIKLMGGNRNTAEQTGVSVAKYTILAFMVAAIGVGLGAALTIIRAGTISGTTASSLGMDVMIAIVLGGMAISGGAKSYMYSATVGTILVYMLNNGLTIMRVDNGIIQAVRGALFLVLILLATKKQNLLPR